MGKLREFWMEEDGIGVVEIILILVILIMIIVIFREQIVAIISDAFGQINGSADTINDDMSLKKD